MATFYEDTMERRRRMLPLATQTLTQDVQPGQAAPVLTRSMELRRKIAELEGSQGQDDGGTSMLNALAAQYAGESFSPIQAQYLKRASASSPQSRMQSQIVRLTREAEIADRMEGQQALQAERLAAQQTQAEANRQAAAERAAQRDETTRFLAAQSAELRKALVAARGQGDGGKLQQGSAFQLPDGAVVQAMFDPTKGYYYDSPTGRVPLPAGSRPTVPSAGGPLPASQFNKLLTDFEDERAALGKLDRYFTTVKDTNVGFARLADQVSSNAKTLFGNPLSAKELNLKIANGQLQGLLGLFRTDIVGPGAMTEYDAQRVLQALGGDVTALQNPQVVERLLRDMYESKKRRVNVLQRQVDYSSRAFPGVAAPTPPVGQFGGGATNTPEFGEPPAGAVKRK